jgi:protein PhnA
MDNTIQDAHGNILHNGDTVIFVKDLKVKGSSVGIKCGTKMKNIRLTDEEEGVTGKIEGMKGIYVRAEFVKKV